MAKRTLRFLLVICLVAHTGWAANDPFAGKWKLNPSQSQLTDLMKVESLGGSKYIVTFAPNAPSETIVANGTDQRGLFGTTLSISIVGPDSWKVVRKKDGQVLLTGIWKLSDDGKTLNDHYTENHPQGSTVTIDYVYQRTAGNSGFPGTWESTTAKMDTAFELQIEPWEGDGLSIVNSSEDVTRNMKFDGKDYPKLGRNVAAGSASSGRRTDDGTLELTDTIQGKVTGTEQIKLSSDLKTLTITVQPVGQKIPNIFVFDRE